MDMNQDREIISFKDTLAAPDERVGAYLEDYFSDDFEFIDQKTIYVDIEKGYKDVEVIIQRIKDKKFFKIEGSISPYVEPEFEIEVKQVFPKTITTIIYE